MLESIHTGIAGMSAFSSALKTISNNVANMNTTGFKASNGTFSNLLYTNEAAQGTLGSNNTSLEYGTGVSYNGMMLDFTQGTLNASSGGLDLAIDGRGFFVTTTAHGDNVYIRTGQFELKDGFVQDKQTGNKLMLRTSAGALVQASTKGKETSAAVASTKVSFTGQVSTDTSTTATDETAPNFNVYDAQGNTHVLQVVLAAGLAANTAGTLNEKTITVKDDKGNELATGKLGLNQATGFVDATESTLDVTITPMGSTNSTKVKLDFSSLIPLEASAQFSANPADGNALGTITSVDGIDPGQLQITYTNGQKVVLGDVAVADFANPQELQALAHGGYTYSGTATPSYNASAKNGVGTVKVQTLEASNVDLTVQFGELILVQRGYQASSQIISTANEMLSHVFELRGQR